MRANNSEIILFAENTYIFVKAGSKDSAYLRAIKVGTWKILNYMACNQLNINLDKHAICTSLISIQLITLL